MENQDPNVILLVTQEPRWYWNIFNCTNSRRASLCRGLSYDFTASAIGCLGTAIWFGFSGKRDSCIAFSVSCIGSVTYASLTKLGQWFFENRARHDALLYSPYNTSNSPTRSESFVEI